MPPYCKSRCSIPQTPGEISGHQIKPGHSLSFSFAHAVVTIVAMYCSLPDVIISRNSSVLPLVILEL